MIITKDLLKKGNACEEGILWFERNFKISIDLDKVVIKGDYKGYIFWIKEELELGLGLGLKKKYDKNGNMIKKIYQNGNIYKFKYEYDKNGNMIKRICPSGDIWKYEYDKNGNMIKKIYPDGYTYEWKYKYDKNNNLTELKENGKIILKIKYL